MKLFIGNLSFETSDQDLREIFGRAGKCVAATVVIDRATGRSRGFGFVEMGSDEEARRAIAELNGASLQGRAMSVNEARERSTGRAPMASGGHRSYGPDRPPAGRGFRKEGGSRRGARRRKRSIF